MKIYLGGNANTKPKHVVTICPAADSDFVKKSEVPVDWVNANNEPLTFRIEFSYGEASAPDSIGKYMIERGLANKTSLILPRGFKKDSNT